MPEFDYLDDISEIYYSHDIGGFNDALIRMSEIVAHGIKKVKQYFDKRHQ